MSDPTRSCYNCGGDISVYASKCDACGADHDPKPRPKAPPKQKTPKNIRAWLAEIGMAAYIVAFEENAVTAEMIADLTDEDLKSIGISKLGDRKKILKAVESFKSAPSPTTSKATAPAPRRTVDHHRYVDEDPPKKDAPSRGKLVLVGVLLLLFTALCCGPIILSQSDKAMEKTECRSTCGKRYCTYNVMTDKLDCIEGLWAACLRECREL